MDADFLAGVVAAALQDELSAGPGRDDRGLPLQLAVRAGTRPLGSVFCRGGKQKKEHVFSRSCFALLKPKRTKHLI